MACLPPCAACGSHAMLVGPLDASAAQHGAYYTSLQPPGDRERRAASLLPLLHDGIAQARADQPVSRRDVELNAEQARLVAMITEAGAVNGAVASRLEVAGRISAGWSLKSPNRMQA